jgi:hypothetical protein
VNRRILLIGLSLALYLVFCTVAVRPSAMAAVNSDVIYTNPRTLEWSTYLGGSENDWAHAVATDRSGNVFAAGTTFSAEWVSGGADTTYNQDADAFVVKISGDGAHLWSTYLGGGGPDYGNAIAVDASGNVLVAGTTFSSGWILGGYDTAYGGDGDAFVVKLSSTGAYVWSTYLGGGDGEEGFGIAVDNTGNAFVTGRTSSSGWVSGGFDTTYDDASDAFAAKLSSSGAHLWSTYLGGGGYDAGRAIAATSEGNVTLTGTTYSPDWTSAGFGATYRGNGDAFAAQLSGDGAHLWSTYLGGADDDYGFALAAGGDGNVYVAGTTRSSGWVSGGADVSYNGASDGFVVVVSRTGSHVWSTYLGGSSDDGAAGIAVNGVGTVFVVGTTNSTGWISGGFDVTWNGYSDAFVAELSPAGAHVWSTYLGGSLEDNGEAIAVGYEGHLRVAGFTSSVGWVSGGYDTTFDGGSGVLGCDAFVAKVRAAPPEMVVTPDSLNFGEWAWDGQTTGPLTVTIENRGAAQLEFIDAGIVVVGEDAWDFGMKGYPDITPIPSGGKRTVDVYFNPRESFPKRATLRLRTNDPYKSIWDVPLRGKGTGRMPAAARKHWTMFE